MESELAQLAEQVVKLFTERGERIASAESCTGGGIAQAITSVSGSSECFEGGFITYSNAAKMSMLGVDRDTLARYGAVSAGVSSEMAMGALHNTRATFTVSVTGVAGPGGGSEEKPVGLVWFGCAQQDSEGNTQVKSVQQQFEGDRESVRAQSVRFALATLLEALRMKGTDA